MDLDRAVSRLDVDAVAARPTPRPARHGSSTSLASRRGSSTELDLTAIARRVIDELDLTEIARRVIDELELTELIRESTTTVSVDTVDAIRVGGMNADRALTRLVDRVLMRKNGSAADVGEGPPRPRRLVSLNGAADPTRAMQGKNAGFVTRLTANVVDGVLLTVTWVGVLLFIGLVRFVAHPLRGFQLPAPPTWVSGLTLCVLAILYFTVTWGGSGRSIGNRMAGLRVTGPAAPAAGCGAGVPAGDALRRVPDRFPLAALQPAERIALRHRALDLGRLRLGAAPTRPRGERQGFALEPKLHTFQSSQPQTNSPISIIFLLYSRYRQLQRRGVMNAHAYECARSACARRHASASQT